MLDDEVMARGKALAAGCWFMGEPLESLTREELIVVAALGWDAERRARAEAASTREFLFDTLGALKRPAKS